ncbi:MAG: hypothetical protein Q7K41_00765, partial [Dehalococcoidales bacterium]|nr:hypothetical protein [Dehalococcoidales bacterium]
MKRRHILPISITLAFLLAFAGCTSSPPSISVPPSTPGANTEVAVTPSVTTSATDIETTLENIYARVNPSVVNISVLEKQGANIPDFPGSPFSGPQGPHQYSQASGSGFAWDTLGHIVTNNHVVANA